MLNGIYKGLRGEETLTVFALEGKENNQSVYTFDLTYAELVKHFKAVEYNPDSELLIQRETQASRINAICDYLPKEYATLPNCGAILEAFNIEKTAISNIVKLVLPASAFRYLFDGQGRLGAIKKLLANDDAFQQFSSNTITIKAYKTQGVKLDNTKFAEWNGQTSKPNKSICQHMDARVLINTFAKSIIDDEAMSLLKSRIDNTKASVTQSQQSKLWSLSQFITAIQNIMGVTAKSAEKLLQEEQKQQFWRAFIIKFITNLFDVTAINSAVSSDKGALKAKQNTVIGTAVFLKGISIAAKLIALHLMQTTSEGGKVDWSFMRKLEAINFNKDNPEWIGRCLDFRGKLQDKPFNHKAIAAYILRTLDIELPVELEEVEDQVLICKAEQRKAEREAKKQEQSKDTEGAEVAA